VPKVGILQRQEELPPASVTVRCAVGHMLENPVNPPLLASPGRTVTAPS
jgi:hypothetical protein